MSFAVYDRSLARLQPYLDECGAGTCARALRNDVERGFQDAAISADNQTASDSRIDVTSANMAKRLK